MSVPCMTALVVDLMKEPYGIPLTCVREVARMPRMAGPPGNAAGVRGILTLRGRTMPVLDLRVLLGYPSRHEDIMELVRILDKCEHDHRTWLAELEASVAESRPFRLTIDPHACAFGRWYDAFMQGELPPGVRMIMARLERPHRMLHEFAAKVLRCVELGHLAEAHRLIQAERDFLLQSLLDLSAEVRAFLASWDDEVAVVVDSPQGPLALAADSIEGINQLQLHLTDPHGDNSRGAPMVQAVGTLQDSERFVSVLRMDDLFRTSTAS